MVKRYVVLASYVKNELNVVSKVVSRAQPPFWMGSFGRRWKNRVPLDAPFIWEGVESLKSAKFQLGTWQLAIDWNYLQNNDKSTINRLIWTNRKKSQAQVFLETISLWVTIWLFALKSIIKNLNERHFFFIIVPLSQLPESALRA